MQNEEGNEWSVWAWDGYLISHVLETFKTEREAVRFWIDNPIPDGFTGTSVEYRRI